MQMLKYKCGCFCDPRYGHASSCMYDNYSSGTYSDNPDEEENVEMNLSILQEQHKKWLDYNFPNADSQQQFLGIVEEVGELSHAILKRSQDIRGDESQHNEDIEDAIGDIIIFICGFCTRENVDLSHCLSKTWKQVSKRDWVKFPGNGVDK